MPSCISTDVLNDYARGKLVGDAALCCEGHLEICPDCQVALGLMFESDHSEGIHFAAALIGSKAASGSGIDECAQATEQCAGAAHQLWKQGRPDFVDHAHPETVGRYRIERLLGRGGFGRVYLATDEKLKRKVAVKIPHPRLIASQEHLAIMLAEAQTVARLDHPGILPIYDVGSTEQIPIFLVSKLISGTTLAEQIEHKSIKPELAAQIVLAVADALQYSHDRSVIHGDVKPQNILIDEAGQVVLADFGLARHALDGPREYRRAGTPAYMSPEQLTATEAPIDHRSDIFSLGKVLCESLDTRQGSEPTECLKHICAKATATELDARFATAGEMAQAIRDCLNAHPTDSSSLAKGASPASRRALRWRTLRLAVVATVLLTVGWFAWARQNRQDSLDQAVQALLSATDSEVPARIDELARYGTRSQSALRAAMSVSDSTQQLRAKLALMSQDDQLVTEVADAMLQSDARSAKQLVTMLQPYRERLIEPMWQLVTVQNVREFERVLNAGAFLAASCPEDARWSEPTAQRQLAEALVQEDLAILPLHADSFQPVKLSIIAGLRSISLQPYPAQSEQSTRTFNVWRIFVGDNIEHTLEVMVSAPPMVFTSIVSRLKPDEKTIQSLREYLRTGAASEPGITASMRIHRKHLVAMALLVLGQTDDYFALWCHSPNPSNITSQLSIVGYPPLTQAVVLNRLRATNALTPRHRLPDTLHEQLFDQSLSERRNLMLALERTDASEMPTDELKSLIAQLRDLCAYEADPGMRAAAAMVLTKFQNSTPEKVGPRSLIDESRMRPQRWSVNESQQILIHMPASPAVPYRFAIADCEIERKQFEKFLQATNYEWSGRKLAQDAAALDEDACCAQVELSWYDCAAFCNWLSQQEQLETCYEPNADGQYAAGMRIKPNILELNGYRMPTGEEWEVSVRAGATTLCSFGETAFQSSRFAWVSPHGKGRTHPVGQLTPNALGLFDTLGNASEWTMDASNGDWLGEVDDARARIHRGGDFSAIRDTSFSCCVKNSALPHERSPHIGLRVVRTLR